MSAPDVQLLLDDGTGTFPYDVSAYVKLPGAGYTIKRGRSTESENIEAAALTVAELENIDGRFTYGSGTYGIRTDQPIKVIETYPGAPDRNLVSAQDASLEAAGTGTWESNTFFGAYTAAASWVRSTAKAWTGTASLLVTWAASPALPTWVDVPVSGFTIGETYTVGIRVWVPSGVPDVRAQVLLMAPGALTSVKNAWVTVTTTFVATATTHKIGPLSVAGTTAGQQIYVDGFMVNKGDRLGVFNTLSPSTMTKFVGYTDEWPLSWPDPTGQYAAVKVTARDRRARLDRRKLRTTIEEEILLDDPLLYYTLGDVAGSSTAGDTSGNAGPVASLAGTPGGFGTALLFGVGDGPGFEDSKAATFNAGQYLATPPSAAAYTGGSFTIAAWVKTSTATCVVAAAGTWASLNIVGGFPEGTSGLSTVTGPAAINDNSWHHVVLTYDGATLRFYVDGSSVGAAAASIVSRAGAIQIGASAAGVVPTLIGRVAHVFYAGTQVSAARISSHYSAGADGFAGDSTDERIARIAAYAGVAPADQSLEAGITRTTAPTPIAGSYAGPAMDAIAIAEGGTVFVAADGKITFHNRQHRVIASTSAASLALDAGDVDHDDLTVTSDRAYLRNVIDGSRPAGATQTFKNAASVVEFDEYPASLGELILGTDVEVTYRITWEANAYGDVMPRISSMRLDLMTAAPTVAAAAFAVEEGDRITIANMPSQSPWSTADLIVEGIEAVRTLDEWSLTFNTAPAELFRAWVLGDSTFGVLGSTTRLHY